MQVGLNKPNKKMEIKEVEIPVPWGIVAAKIWGNVNHPPILCFHGLQDNAGTFNRLIPLLPQHFQYICIDLPGHGRSSYFPPHLPIYTINYLIVYQLIMDYFGKERYIIMGHSYGGQIALLFSRLFPQKVEKLILLDTFNLFPVSTKYYGDYLKDKIEHYFDDTNKIANTSIARPTYTYEEALSRLRSRRSNGTITAPAAKALLERLLVPVGDGKYQFSVDQRLKNVFNPLHDFRYVLETYKNHTLTCPVIILIGKNSQSQQMFMKPIIKMFQKQRNIIMKKVDGDHDVHNDSPELVAPYIIKFLGNKSKL